MMSKYKMDKLNDDPMDKLNDDPIGNKIELQDKEHEEFDLFDEFHFDNQKTVYFHDSLKKGDVIRIKISHFDMISYLIFY